MEPATEKNHLSVSTRFSYGFGDTACNIVFGMISTLLTLFYTDYVGISVATVGLVMLISRVFDGTSDVIMGFIVNRTKSKWGKARPLDPVDEYSLLYFCDCTVFSATD